MVTTTAKTAAALQISPSFQVKPPSVTQEGSGWKANWGWEKQRDTKGSRRVGVILMLVRLSTGVMGLSETPLCPGKKATWCCKEKRGSERETDRHTERGREGED